MPKSNNAKCYVCDHPRRQHFRQIFEEQVFYSGQPRTLLGHYTDFGICHCTVRPMQPVFTKADAKLIGARR